MVKSKVKTRRTDGNGSHPDDIVVTVRTQGLTTSKGVHCLLQGLPPLEVPEIYASVPEPEKPKYSITTATGDIETHDHDKESIKGDPEAEKAWEEYTKALQESEEILSNRMMNAILLEGVVVYPTDEEFAIWKKKQSLKGLEVSEDKEEALLQYKRTIFASKEEIEAIMTIVMELTGVSEEDLSKARESFPDSVEPES